MTFPYKQYDVAPGLRPIIPVGVELDGQVLRYEVLVDSGADINVFDQSIADALGIDLASGDEASIQGATGASQTIFFHDVVLHVGNERITTRAGFTELPSTTYGVVGQRGFFDYFRVAFDRRAEEIKLKRYGS